MKQPPQTDAASLREAIDSAPSRTLNRQLVEFLRPALPLSRYPLRTAAAGQWLARAGERLTQLPIVESGRLELLVLAVALGRVLHAGDQGRQVIPVTFEAGELALSSALFGVEPIDMDLVVGADLAARWVPIGDIERCLLQSRDMLVLMVRMLAQRLREVQARELGWLQRGVHDRVRAVLQRITRPRADGRVMIEVTHEHLAARCGLSRPKLSQELKLMEHAGMLKLHRGAIEFVDPAYLARPD